MYPDKVTTHEMVRILKWEDKLALLELVKKTLIKMFTYMSQYSSGCEEL